MVRILRKLKKIFRKLGIQWLTQFIYVDDYRLILKSLKKGVVI